MNTVDKEVLTVAGLVGITFCTGLALASSYVSADDVVDDVSVTVPSSCTLSGSGMTSHDAEIANGTYQPNVGTTTMNVFCNDSAGFSIYAAGYSGNVIGGENSNKLIGTSTSNYATIATGTATSAGDPDVSNWAMKLATDSQATYPITLSTGYDAFHAVPNEYTKVATRLSGTDSGQSATGASLTTTYGAYISRTQPADSYAGKVKYVLVHPNAAPAPEPCPNNEPCIRVATPPTKTTYQDGENIDLTGIVVKLYNSDGSEQRTIPIIDTTVIPMTAEKSFLLYTRPIFKLVPADLDVTNGVFRTRDIAVGGSGRIYYSFEELGFSAGDTIRISGSYSLSSSSGNFAITNINDSGQTNRTIASGNTVGVTNVDYTYTLGNYYDKYLVVSHNAYNCISDYSNISITKTNSNIRTVTISWQNPDTGATLTTSFNITVNSGE